MSELRRILAGRIKQARKEAGFTQGQLADKIGMANHSILSRYETGVRKPDSETLEAIAAATGKPLDFFLGEFGDVPEHRAGHLFWDQDSYDTRYTGKDPVSAFQAYDLAERFTGFLDELGVDTADGGVDFLTVLDNEEDRNTNYGDSILQFVKLTDIERAWELIDEGYDPKALAKQLLDECEKRRLTDTLRFLPAKLRQKYLVANDSRIGPDYEVKHNVLPAPTPPPHDTETAPAESPTDPGESENKKAPGSSGSRKKRPRGRKGSSRKQSENRSSRKRARESGSGEDSE